MTRATSSARNQIEFLYIAIKKDDATFEAHELRNWANALQQELTNAVSGELSSEFNSEGAYLQEIKFNPEYDKDSMTYAEFVKTLSGNDNFQIIENMASLDGEKCIGTVEYL